MTLPSVPTVSPLEQLALAIDFARYRFSWWGVGYTLCVVSVGMLVFLVLWGRGSRASLEVRRAFALDMVSVALSIAAIGAAIGAGDRLQATATTRVGLIPATLLGPLTLNFVSVLVGWQRALRPWVLATGAFGLALGGLAMTTPWLVTGAWSTPFGFAAIAGPLAPLAILQLAGCMIASMAVLAGRLRHSSDPRVRRQLRAVLVAYGIGNLTLIDILPMWGIMVFPSSFLCVTVSAVVLSVAIHEHQLLDAPDFGWRALAWLSTSALVVVPVLVVLGLLHSWGGWGEPLPTTVVLFGVFLLVRAYHTRLQPKIDDLFLRRRRDLQRELTGLAENLLVLRTAGEIADEVARMLHRTLYARLTAFAVREEDGWRILHSAWGQLPAPDDDDPVVRQLAADPQLVQRGEHQGGEPDAAATDKLFQRYGAEVLLPIPGGDDHGVRGLQGLVAVGPRWDARPFEPYELSFLQKVPGAVAGPLAAARLYDRGHRLREELEGKVAAKSADLARALSGLENAQAQLVQGEKMSTLGLVVGGVAAELKSAVDEVDAHVPRLLAVARASEAAAVEYLGTLPAAKLDEVTAWTKRSGFEFVRGDITNVANAVTEGARRAAGIAHDLSRFARAEGAEAEPADLHREIDATLNLVTSVLGSRITVAREYEAALPAVTCERGPIGQVFMNLFINAAQAIDGRGQLRVRTRIVEDGHFVEVAVRDSGKGIPPDVLPKIFEPFFTTKPLGQSGGSGLGLSISYGIVQRHGGKILVDSQVGHGTEIRVVLPVGGPGRLRG